jgi:hypothetical protein
MSMILKSLWTRKKQNGWIFAEIAIISCLSWFIVDFLTVTFYATHFCIPAGEFEKDHLCVGQLGIVRSESASEGQDITEEEARGVYVIRDKLATMPEVASVCLTPDYLGANLRFYNWRTLALADDTTRTIGFSQFFYYQNEHFFETQGLRAIEGSPDAETLSRQIAPDGIVMTRSVAQMLFGHDHVIGKRVAMVDTRYEGGEIVHGVVGYHTIAGVVEDVKGAPNERYPYVVFFPNPGSGASAYCQLLVRLKPDADAKIFVKQLTPTLTNDFRAGICVLGSLETYQQHYDKQVAHDYTMYTTLATVPLVLFGIIVVLGTLGTFWLQIRKRTEDIGIMRSFGAKRRDIFLQIWGEAAVLTALAVFTGCLVWFQVAIHWDVLSDGNAYGGSGRETDWVSQFWPHFLIVSSIQYLLLLAIVTLGMVVPTFRAMYKHPVEALHHE